ncbi:AAA family ATPase [Sporomusa acidovorans]|uniref:AAA family ATPase n=1 Tax=Sporomusa acidovorans TaxID=112900 RepID=UPI0008832108|nr:AAA family ATPase [Sporomusa acidovorans]OZC19004.1 DNA replication and repair protein RecF [Sporomusa acidovorans DSM 3132]SDD72754.1 AAA domain-containing protein [Sporomusa acidovorans]
MKNIRLTRLYLKNYKLFQATTLEFSDGLNIFDGPNGYGKTSIFDAIEFIITGTIKRITENSSINGALKYDELFLANDSSKDVIIKAEFTISDKTNLEKDESNSEKKVIIAKKVLAVGHESGTTNYNPKKLTDITNTYLLTDFDIEEFNSSQIISKSDLENFQKEIFGDTSQNLFFMLYYVKQEDRLDFFKNTEKDRVKSIDSLFQIKQEQEKLKNINDGKKNLKNVIDNLDNEIKRLSENLSKDLGNTAGHQCDYIKLLVKDVPWDLETIEINNQKDLESILQQLRAIKSIVTNIKFYKEDIKNIACQKFLDLNENVRHADLRAFCLYNEIAGNMPIYITKQKNMKLLQEQKQLANEGKFNDVDFVKLFEMLQIDDSDNIILHITQLIKDYKENKNSSVSAQQTLSDIIRIRQQLIDKFKTEEAFSSNGECPYCGFDWKDAEVFAKNVEITSERLSKLVNGSEKRCLDILAELKDLFEKQLSNALQKELDTFNSNILLVEFNQIHNTSNLQKYENVKNLLEKIGLDTTSYKFNADNAKEVYERIEKGIGNKIVLLPTEYINEKETHKYSQFVELFFDSIKNIEETLPLNIDKKISYIHYKFIISQNDLMTKIKKLTDFKNRLASEVHKDLDNYLKFWKKCISKVSVKPSRTCTIKTSDAKIDSERIKWTHIDS